MVVVGTASDAVAAWVSPAPGRLGREWWRSSALLIRRLMQGGPFTKLGAGRAGGMWRTSRSRHPSSCLSGSPGEKRTVGQQGGEHRGLCASAAEQGPKDCRRRLIVLFSCGTGPMLARERRIAANCSISIAGRRCARPGAARILLSNRVARRQVHEGVGWRTAVRRGASSPSVPAPVAETDHQALRTAPAGRAVKQVSYRS